MASRQTFLRGAALCVGYVAAGVLSRSIPPESRALGLLCLIAILSMIASAFSRARPLPWIAIMAAATLLDLVMLFFYRRWFDSMAAVGPVPRSLEPVALAVLGAVNLAAGSLVTLGFSAPGRMFRFRWLVFGATALAVLGLCVSASRRTERAYSPQALMARVVLLEQSSARNDWGARQELSTDLAILGRQREARAMALGPDAVGQDLSDPPDTPGSAPPFAVTPWREAMTRIAAEQRLVLIMEAHTITEHRAWIEQTLGPLRRAGFTHYFAETIAEAGSTLKARGYPTSRTGVYTLDPRFGNLVRTAIRVGFEVDGYDRAEPVFERREEAQAAALAVRFTSRPDTRMVVHAGHGHIFKYEVHDVGRYMAARLWEKTRVEPFTIWQLSNALPNRIYRTLIRQIGPITEPVMLVPPPRDVSEALFPESSAHPAVDAIVIHPPRIGREPADRRGAFTDHLRRVPGVWLGRRWPVVIAALPTGESDEAIALDQVLLRQGETAFELWLPRARYTLRAWSLDGRIDVVAKVGPTSTQVEIGHPR